MKWKTILLGILTIGLSVAYGLLQRSKTKLATERQQDAEIQRDVLQRANENVTKAHQKGIKNENDARDHMDRGDWSDLE